MTGRIVGPIRHVLAATRRISAGNYDERVPVAEDDELPLSESFNAMAAALEEQEPQGVHLRRLPEQPALHAPGLHGGPARRGDLPHRRDLGTHVRRNRAHAPARGRPPPALQRRGGTSGARYRSLPTRGTHPPRRGGHAATVHREGVRLRGEISKPCQWCWPTPTGSSRS